MNWAVGVTTVPSRRNDLLPTALNSLCDAGFSDVHLFVDGCDDPSLYSQFGRLVSLRPTPALGIVGNWMLAMWELYVRNPKANRFVLFQDDILAVGNLREFLEKSPYPKKRAFLNLYLNRQNKAIVKTQKGWHPSNQLCQGALGLVFDRDALHAILSSNHMVAKPLTTPPRDRKNVDGGISTSMKNAGFIEYVHNPSLLQHIGRISTVGNTERDGKTSRYPPIDWFPGENFDAMEFLR